MSDTPSHKYVVLDGLRGVAAFGVMLFHFHQAFPALQRNAYLAVDLFFLLSGFVIAHAYERRLLADMSLAAFLRIRLIRLWPLFALGCVLGAPVYLAKAGVAHAAAIMPNIFLLPAMPGASPEGYLFPIDIPAWSLLFEIIANVAYAAMARRLTRNRLIALVAAMAACVAVAAWRRGNLGGGDTWDSLESGFARVGFSFFAGILLYRQPIRMPKLSAGARNTASLVLVAVLLAVFQMQASSTWRWICDLGFVLVLSPAIVTAGAMLTVSPPLQKVFAQFGFASYALYVLHESIASYVTSIARALHAIGGVADPVLLPLKVAAVVPLAYLAAYIYDVPVRRWLSGRTHLRADIKTKPRTDAT